VEKQKIKIVATTFRETSETEKRAVAEVLLKHLDDGKTKEKADGDEEGNGISR